jgi:Na+-driven multidrug efflux pump
VDVIHIFTREPVLVDVSVIYLKIAMVGYLTMAPVSVLQSCINGAGDTLVAMLISLFNMWVIQVPMAYALPHYTSLGALGVRWALVAGHLTSAIAYLAYFKGGRWQRKNV